jgi:hypothetical protein
MDEAAELRVRLHAQYRLYRDYVTHEDALINNRTTWLINLESFIIATFGFSYQKKFEIVTKPAAELNALIAPKMITEYNWFLVTLAFAGLIIAVVSLVSIRAADLSIKSIEQKFEAKYRMHPSYDELPKLTGGGHASASMDGFRFSQLLPRFFAVAWTLVILKVLFVPVTGFSINLFSLPIR